MGDIDGAVEANRQFIETMERAYDGPHPSMGAAYNNRAILLRDQGDLEGALQNYQMSIDMQDAVDLPARHPNRSFPTAGIASVYLRQQRYAEAETIFRDMTAIRSEGFGESHLLVSELKSELGAALIGLGELDEAESLLAEVYLKFFEQRGSDDPRTTLAARRLAEIYTLTGDVAKAAEYRELSGDNAP
jgi:tetratricopeptide (TPR) repeat protein